MKYLNKNIIFLLLFLSINYTTKGQENNTLGVEDSTSTIDSRFLDRFHSHRPMYLGISKSKPHYSEENLLFIKFQISFRYDIANIYTSKKSLFNVKLDVAYTQTSFWDIESKSQPFYDNSYKPGAFFMIQNIQGNSWSWLDRFDIESGYQHHSNGRDGVSSRYIDWLYFQPKFTWRIYDMSSFTFSPMIWHYLTKSTLNDDIIKYWGRFNLEFVYLTDSGFQLRTMINPANERTSSMFQLTYPLNKLIKPLNFYLMATYYNGVGETILDYNKTAKGFIFGISLTR